MIPEGKEGLAERGNTEKPSQRFDHDVGRNDVFLEIVEELMTGLVESRKQPVPTRRRPMVTPRDLPDVVFGFQQHGRMRDRVLFAERLLLDGNAEKSRHPQRLVSSELFEMPPQHLGPNIYTKHHLRQGT